MTSTGNTKKVAEAIYGEIDGEKEIKPIGEVQDLGAYDLSFLGFPTHQEGPDKKTRELLAKHCTAGRNVALFVTHAAPESAPDVPSWMALFKQAAAGANMVGFFDCQGQLSSGVKMVLRLSPNKKYRVWAKSDNSQGQPDKDRLDRAKTFARETLSKAPASIKGH
jgi:flavodoxin